MLVCFPCFYDRENYAYSQTYFITLAYILEFNNFVQCNYEFVCSIKLIECENVENVTVGCLNYFNIVLVECNDKYCAIYEWNVLP